MSGVGKTVNLIGNSGINYIDGLLSGRAWGGTITYAFPTAWSAYGAYPTANVPYEQSTFQGVSASVREAAIFALEGTSAANRGFSVEGFTNASIQTGADANGTVRYGFTAMNGTGYDGYAVVPANGPNSQRAGDVWLKTSSHANAVEGNKAWYNVLHETGHALGLKHPSDANYGKPVMNPATDAMEYTIMSYKAYPGSPVNFGNETWGYAQTFMRADIAALQRMYGADFTANAGNTTYKWSPGSGNTLIDGVAAITPGANKIFLTIWDGGGVDTYDLSAYATNLTIDLRPGEWSNFGTNQNANLGGGHKAAGMIYNSYLYNNDARSLIENVMGGSGSDEIIGNAARNELRGGAGNDTLFGEGGIDTLIGGNGNDVLLGGPGADVLQGGAGVDTASYAFAAAGVIASLHAGQGTQGEAAGDTYAGIENLQGSSHNDTLVGNAGNNSIWGRAGADRINGAAGNDTMTGGAGNDTFVFGAGVTGRDVITDFDQAGNDVVDLRGNEYLPNYLTVTLSMYQVGSDVEIRSLDGDVIVLNNTSLSSMDSSDFIFT